MKYRRLGKTELMISEIGIGGAGITENYGEFNEKESIQTLSRGLDLGINYIDTAPSYGGGKSEIVVGRVLKGRRDSCYVATKVGGDLSEETILQKFPESLERLQMDYVDILMLHDIHNFGSGREAASRIMDKGGALEALRQLKDKGLIRNIGVSGVLYELTEFMKEMAKTGEIDMIIAFNKFNLLNQDADKVLIPLCAENDIGIVIGGPFYQGFLVSDLDTMIDRRRKGHWWKSDLPDELWNSIIEKLPKLYKRYGKDRRLREKAIKFILSNQNISCVITGARTVGQIEENVGYSDGNLLAEEEINEIIKL